MEILAARHVEVAPDELTKLGAATPLQQSLRMLMSIDENDRNIEWLRNMLQFAVELEFDTLPPYLFAMWSIKDLTSPASLFLSPTP